MTNRFHAVVSPLFLSLLLCPLLAWAQPSSTRGVVRGTVTDQSGGVVVGADVRLEGVRPGGARLKTQTDPTGRYLFDAVAAGSYLLVVRHRGLAPYTAVIDVAAEGVTRGDVQLAPAGVSEDVVVTATRLDTPVSSIPNTVTIVTQQAIEGRTAISDDLASLLEANVPGFAPSLKKMTGRGESFRGRNPLYAVNGVPQHTPLRDGERDGHTIDLDFIDRIEVIHGANAIQGIGATGGVINMVTKSPRRDGRLTQDVKLSFGNAAGLDDRGWSSKLSYLAGKRIGRVDFVAGVALQKRGLFFDAEGEPVGLYPTQGDIMDSTSRGLYGKVGVDFTRARRLEVSINDFRLSRDGDFVSVPGDRAVGRLTTSVEGDPRPSVGDPALNDVTTVSADYRDRNFFGGDATIQVYAQDYRARFEGGAFTTFALTVGGPAFLDQSAITTDKLGAKLTYAMPNISLAGVTPVVGLDLSQDESAQVLTRTDRVWVPETIFREAAPFVQLQRVLFDRVLVSGGARIEFAQLRVNDFTTLPSSGSTFVSGGSPSFTEVLPNVGIVVPIDSRLSVYSSFSEGFTMPDVGRVLRAVSTPGLDVDTLVDIEPVVAGSLEFGADYKLSGARFHAAYYRSVSERGSLLERDAENIFHVRRQPTTIDGVDLVAEGQLSERWTAGVNYSWIRGRFDSNGDGVRDSGLDGLNIAPNRINVFVQGSGFGPLSGRLQVSTLLDRKFSGLAAPIGRDFSGYATADLSLGFSIRGGVIRLGLENLLDRQYVVYFSQVDPAGANDTFFAGPGRSFTLSLERRF